MSDPYAQRRIRALAWEARRQGVSCGILCSRLRPGEEEEILRRYNQAMGSTPKEQRPKRPRHQDGNWPEGKALYDQGLTDKEIAERLGVGRGTWASLRWRHKLPPNRKKKGGAADECG